MAVGRHDIELAGIKYRLDRQAESPYQRSAAALRFASQTSNVGQVLHYREDLLDAHQTDWSGGSMWWKPRLTPDAPNAYHTQSRFDGWTEPGKLRPAQKFETDTTPTFAHTYGSHLVQNFENWYLIATDGKVLRYAGLGDWVQHFTATLGGTPVVFSTVNSHETGNWLFYTLTTAGIYRVSGSGTVQNHAPTPIAPDTGSTLLWWHGRLLYYNGYRLYEVDQTLTNTFTVVGEDANGFSFLTQIAAPATGKIPYTALREATVGDDGIYLMKTSAGLSSGQQQPIISKFSTDGETDLLEEICRLTSGTVALSCFWHMGQLLILCASNVSFVNNSSSVLPQTTLYFVQNRQPGVLYRFDPDDSPTHFLGCHEHQVYLASSSSIWVYDPARGTIHRVVDLAGVVSMGQHVPTSAANELFFVQGENVATRQTYYQSLKPDPTDRVFATGDLAEWQGNWIDFDAPNEQKVLSRISLLTEPMSGGSYTVKVRVDTDAASQTTILTATSGHFNQALITDSAIVGRRFQLEIEYTGSVATPAVLSVSLEAIGQEYVKLWDLTLDGADAANVENEPVRTTTIDDNLDVLVATAQPVTFKDGYRSADPVDFQTHTVRVESVQMVKKGQPDRMSARVRLVEVPA